MPRPGADQVGGFFEFPPELLPALCGTITATIPSGEKTASLTLLDLCAGEGTAIHALATHVWRLTGARCSVTAAELEESRAATAKALIESGGSCWGNVHHEDAFRLRPRDGGARISLAPTWRCLTHLTGSTASMDAWRSAGANVSRTC